MKVAGLCRLKRLIITSTSHSKLRKASIFFFELSQTLFSYTRIRTTIEEEKAASLSESFFQ
jgi:hypothetical protein